MVLFKIVVIFLFLKGVCDASAWNESEWQQEAFYCECSSAPQA